MYIKTTLNIHKDIKDIIDDASYILEISRTKVISMLLKKLVKENKINILFAKGLKYQDSDDPDNWETFHISYRQDEYDLFNDLKKIHNCSVSYLVSFAVRKFLTGLISNDSLLSENKRIHTRKTLLKIIGDNYRFNSYIFVREVISGVISWRIFWGLPPNLSEILQMPS